MGGGSWIDYMKRELHKDDVEFDASESIPYLEWSTEYIVYTYGMNSAGTKTTPVYTKTFKTLDPAPSNNQITTNVKKVYKDGADVEVTTTNDDTYYITAERAEYVEYFKGDNEAMLRQLFTQETLDKHLYNGSQTIKVNARRRDTDYYVIIVGYNGGPSTTVQLLPFHTAAQ